MDSFACTLFLFSHLKKLHLDIDWEMRVHPSSNNPSMLLARVRRTRETLRHHLLITDCQYI